MGFVGLLLIAFITFFFPPIGVFMVAGCGPDLCINIILTILAFFPGMIHAYYVLFVYYDRRETVRSGMPLASPAPGIFSQRVQTGGYREYSTVH